MKRTRIALGVLIVMALVAVVLQIFNKNTDEIETIYEIIAFLVAFTAVFLAILQGIDNAKTTRRLEKLIREMRELMKVEAQDRERDMSLEKEIKKDLEINEEELKMLEKYRQHDEISENSN